MEMYEPTTLALLDLVAQSGLAIAHPVRFRRAESLDEREVTYRIRYEAVIKEGWNKPEDYPGELESDSRDEKALHILGCDGDLAVATARLIFPEAGRLLPTEEAFELEIEPRGRVVDMGRVVVATSHSDMRHRVLAGLMAFAWCEIISRGFAFACGAFASSAAIRLYKQMGFKIDILAPSRLYWGEVRYPVLFDVLGSVNELGRRWLSHQDGKQASEEGGHGW